MGRKIPGRKHRGVVDPLKQKKQREDELKKIINAPPTSLDQPVPKSMLEFMRLKQIGQKPKLDKKGKKKKDADGTYMRQFHKEDKGKSKGNFKHSLKKKNKAEGESEQSEIIRPQSEKQQDDSFDASDDEAIDKTFGKLKWKNGLEKRKKKLEGADQKKKVDRRVEKRKKMLDKKREKMEEKTRQLKKDVVSFGEVAHEPPSMRIKPKYASDNERQMGLKDLHLKRLLMRGTVAPVPVAVVSGATESKQKSKSRLRDLPAKERLEAERKQRDAIAAYKLLKAKSNAQARQR